jgi:KDO2-lipid IV(A) lauroyltransferase
MRAVFFFLSLLPLKPAKSFIRLLMRVIPLGIFSSYKTTHININISFENLSIKEKEAMARRSFVESVCSLYETFYSLSRSSKEISKNIVRVDNRYLMSEALKDKNGLLISGIHNRSVDLILQWINTQTPTVGVYKPLKNSHLDSYIKKHREQTKNKIYTTSYKGVKELFKALLKNKVIMMASDQVPQDGMGEYAKFFNRDAYTTTLITSLANKTSKPLIYMGLFSAPQDCLKITIKKSPKEISVQSMNSTMEEMILTCPEDYSWEYKRFKKPPEGIDSPY